MATTDATWLDQAGHVRLVGQLETAEAVGLPTGWTEDASDPANVSSNDGGLDLGAGVLNGGINVNTGIVADLTANDALIGTSAANHVGFYGATAIVQQTGVAVTAAGIHAALVNLGLITA